MGQQQLLLLILGVVIVGLAVVLGLSVFRQSARQSTADALVERNVHIAAKAYAQSARNALFNGGTRTYDGLEGHLDHLGMENKTPLGTFAITAAAGGTLEIVGVSARYPELGARTLVTHYDEITSEVKYDGSITLPAGGE